MSLIIEIHCFPTIDYFKILSSYSNVEFEVCENFQKSSFRNRYVISGANGLVNLTVPISGGREQKNRIREIEIDYSEEWTMKHWRTLLSAYGNSPFFEYYADALKQLLFSGEIRLLEFNMSLLKWLFKVLKFDMQYEWTTQYRKDYPRLNDYRNLLRPNDQTHSNLEWEPKYSQVFEERFGFQSNLSILDLLFNQGPRAELLIKNSKIN